MQSGGSSSGSNIYQSSFTGNTNQKFKIVLVEGSGSSAYYNIIPMVNTTLRLDIANMSTANGTNVKLFNISTGYPSAQRFKFTSNGDGSYRIIPKCCANSTPNEVVEVAGPYQTNGANVQIWDWVGGSGQKWILENATESPSTMGWQWTFRGATPYLHLSQRYSSNHLGIDSNASRGTGIYSTCSGTVIPNGECWDNSMGYYVVVTAHDTCDGETLTVRYMHMKERSSLRVGDSVTQSTLIGYVGNTGTVYPAPSDGNPYAGTHLHMDVNTLNTPWGNYLTLSNTIDPEEFFPNSNFTY